MCSYAGNLVFTSLFWLDKLRFSWEIQYVFCRCLVAGCTVFALHLVWRRVVWTQKIRWEISKNRLTVVYRNGQLHFFRHPDRTTRWTALNYGFMTCFRFMQSLEIYVYACSDHYKEDSFWSVFNREENQKQFFIGLFRRCVGVSKQLTKLLLAGHLLLSGSCES